MTSTQSTLIAGLIASPFAISIVEWVRNKITTFFTFRGWQALFLTNDQVYFGKITSIYRNELSLKNIYYIKAPEKGKSPSRALKENEYKLVKLGDELHGPKDHMMINRNQISFIENLKESAPVVKKIYEYENKK